MANAAWSPGSTEAGNMARGGAGVVSGGAPAKTATVRPRIGPLLPTGARRGRIVTGAPSNQTVARVRPGCSDRDAEPSGGSGSTIARTHCRHGDTTQKRASPSRNIAEVTIRSAGVRNLYWIENVPVFPPFQAVGPKRLAIDGLL